MYNEKGQSSAQLAHTLELVHPDGTPAAPKRVPPRVFISGSLSDAGVIQNIARNLLTVGVDVSTHPSILSPVRFGKLP